MNKPFPISGVGSLPFQEVDTAVKYAEKMDIKYVPQLPLANKWELMIPQTLKGFSGIQFGPSGKIDLSSNSKAIKVYEPSENYLCWDKILEARPNVLKVQITGIGTLLRYVGGAQLLKDEIIELIKLKTTSIIQILNDQKISSIISFDEPAGITKEIIHEYEQIFSLQNNYDCKVGIHCCSDTDWSYLFKSTCKFISYDSELSQDSVFEHKSQLQDFFKRGGILAPGIVPTIHYDQFNLNAVTSNFWSKLMTTFSPLELKHYSKNILLTASCGHAYRPADETYKTVDTLREVQKNLMQNLKRLLENC